MYEQLYISSPFGLEKVVAEYHFVQSWGWAWAVKTWDTYRWQDVDSGYARSDRHAMRELARVLELLAAYEEGMEPEDDVF